MGEVNWRYLGELGLAVILLVAAISLFLTGAVRAEDNGSYIITNSPTYPFHPWYRIANQGQVVYVNDTVDISGQGWGEGIAWYGKYSEYDSPQYLYIFSPYKRDVINFYLDPAIFAGKSGMWYQYYGNQTKDRRGNLQTFKVSENYRNRSVTYSNGTTILLSELISNETDVATPQNPYILPEIQKTDYLVATGDPLFINSSRVWMFGRVDGMYAYDGNFTIHDIQQLETGSYKIVTHNSGNNTIIEVGYNNKTQAFTSPWKGVDDASVYGSQPMLDINKFYWMIKNTDDKIQTYDMELEEPAVSIVSIDEVAVGSRITLAWSPGMTLLDVRGYSNVQNGSIISLVMDPDRQTIRTIKANTWNTTAVRTSPGNMSQYQVYIPINKNEMPNGIHTIRASTAIGGKMFYDFPISELPANSYVPNATLKYIMGRNPWEPNLTIPAPIIVIQTQVVERVVEKPVPPSEETILEQQRVVYWEGVNRIAISIAWVCIAIIGMFGLLWAYRIHKRTMKEKEWFKRQN
jgi:hypothetical protein